MRAILDLCADAPLQYFEQGDVLLAEGQQTGRLYVLAAGEIDIFRRGARVTVLSEPGAIVGEMSVLLGVPHTATARARDEVRAHVISDASAFLAGHPELAWLMARVLARRLNAATTYLAGLKRQVAASGDHWSMVVDALESLIHQQGEDVRPDFGAYPHGP